MPDSLWENSFNCREQNENNHNHLELLWFFQCSIFGRMGDELRPSIFGVNLRRLREAVRPKLTQAELGRRVGKNQATISNLETGETQYPSADLARQLAEELAVPLEEFWRPVDEPGPSEAETLQEFLQSPIGRKLGPEQQAKLRRAGWILRRPTAVSWQHLWEAIRAEEGGDERA